MSLYPMSEKQVVRWWSNVVVTDGCWHWAGDINHKGYGRMYANGRSIGAHRIGYQMLRGEIPDGMEIDHLCKNRSCVCPDHLEVVTHKENVLRGDNFSAKYARRTHCDRCGLALAGDNLRIQVENGKPRRRCVNCKRRTCRDNQRKYRAQKSEV